LPPVRVPPGASLSFLDELERRVRARVPERNLEGIRAVAAVLVEHG
jgi:hypothetical protein